MTILTRRRNPGPVRQASPGKRLRHHGVLLSIAGSACLLSPLGASATTLSISTRSVYADPCTTATTSGTNPTINSSSCSGSTYRPSTTSHTTVDTLTTPNGDYVAFPDTLPSNPTLVVFLGGGASAPNAYTQFAERAAYKGFAAISLNYPNGSIGATSNEVCGASSDCFTALHGSAAFGSTPYNPALSSTTYGPVPCTSSTKNACNSWISSTNDPTCTAWTDGTDTSFNICYKDSVVGRLVAALQLLQSSTPSPSKTNWSSFWSQFLTTSASSPYYGAYPNWPGIILAGHSEGGAEVTFLAMNLPSATGGGNLAQRVILFSAPEDNRSSTNVLCYSPPPSNTSYTPAAWITNSSPLPLGRFWGLRSGNSTGASTEGCYGAQVAYNWSNFEGTGGTGIPQGSGSVILDDGGCLNPGSGSPCTVATGQHRFVITLPLNTSDLYNHDDTVVDYGPYSTNLSQADPDVAYVWDKLLTAAP
jgi:hypothetical protein